MAQARTARMRAPAARASGGSARASKATGASRSTRTDGYGPAPAGEVTEVDAVLGLQESVGNQAVVQLLAGGGAATSTPPAGFTGNRALATMLTPRAQRGGATIQREMAVTADPKMRVQLLRDAIRLERMWNMFLIDFDKASEALSNLTAADGRTVMRDYEAQKGWNLGYILSATQSLHPDLPPATNNLRKEDRTRLQYMLLGTAEKPAELAPAPATPGPAAAVPAAAPAASAAGPATGSDTVTPTAPTPVDPDSQRVGENRIRVQAASLKAALARKDVVKAIALIPASAQERRDLDTVYEAHYGQTAYMALFTKLPGKQGQRAAALWYDEGDVADRLALEAAGEARDKANKEAAELEGAGFGVMKDEARRRRTDAQVKLEAEIKRVSQSGDQTTAAGRAAGKERLKKVVALGDPKGDLAKKIGIGSDAVSKAIAEGDEAAELGARLARADERTDVSTEDVESTLRQLRDLATDAADRTIEIQPQVFELVADQITKGMVDGYYQRFVTSFNKHQKRRPFDQFVAGRGGAEEKAATLMGVSIDELREISGKSSDVARNKELLAKRGRLEEWQELFYALNREPKDIERARAILEPKTITQVRVLAFQYMANTGLRSLEVDLLGTDIQQKIAQAVGGGEGREGIADKRAILLGGRFDRALAEAAAPSNLQGDARAAHLLAAEGQWLYNRIGGLERRVIENRGYFAKVRDWSGNEERSILDLARRDALTAKAALGSALTPDRGTTWKAGEEGTRLNANIAEAKKQIGQLCRIDARLTHAVGIYKEATKKAYEEFVDLVVTAASIAAGFGVTGLWITALRTTAATIGTKILMKGNDYTVDEFIADVQGGMAGVAGDFAKLGAKHLVAPYVAGKIARLARKVGVSKEFYAKVEARLGPLALRQAEHTFGTAASNVYEGKGVLEGQGLGARVKGEVQGQVVGGIEQAIIKRPAAGATGDAGEEQPARRPGDDELEQYGPIRQGEEQGGAGGARRGTSTEAGGDAGPGLATAVDEGAPAASGGETDEAPVPRVSMALEPRGRPGGRRKPPPIPKPRRAPPAEPPAATPAEVPRAVDPPRTAGPAAKPGSEPGQTGARRGRKPQQVPAVPHAPKVEPASAKSAEALEYPPGATVLNAPGQGGDPAPPRRSGRERDAENLAALHPRAHSEDRRRQADETLRKAEAGLRQAEKLGMQEGGPWYDLARHGLREARAAQAIAYGRRAPTDKELQRINATENLVDAEVEYAAARASNTWKEREAAQRAHGDATTRHAAARDALAAAHQLVRQGQEASPHGAPPPDAVRTFDEANAAFRVAQQDLAAAGTRLDGAHAADWRSRRAWAGIRYARRQHNLAIGGERSVPPPIPGAALRRGQRPVAGPAQHEDTRFPPHLWDRELVIQLADATSLREHQDLVFRMLHEDSTREIGLFRNSKTGQWIVVRGKERTVVVESAPGSSDEKGGAGPLGAGQAQRWKELLGQGGDVGEWELIAHSHPSTPGQGVERISRYPSGYKGDFSVLRNESEREGFTPKSSTIYYMDNGVRRQTNFGYDPNNIKPYWFQIAGEPPQRFQTLEDYHRHATEALVPYGSGNQPAFEPIPNGYQERFGMEGADDEP